MIIAQYKKKHKKKKKNMAAKKIVVHDFLTNSKPYVATITNENRMMLFIIN
jgi:hypothetical protein